MTRPAQGGQRRIPRLGRPARAWLPWATTRRRTGHRGSSPQRTAIGKRFAGRCDTAIRLSTANHASLIAVELDGSLSNASAWCYTTRPSRRFA
jgi:hypothetical protein